MNLLGQMAGAVFLGSAGPCASNFAALAAVLRCGGLLLGRAVRAR